MKKNFKKIISLVLTVLMLVGTFSAIIPMTASAADDTDIIKEVITGNTDVKINDITMRMDYPTPSHAPSTLTLCSDGSVIIKGNRGDLFWMPNVEITANSVITTTVTMDSATDHLCGRSRHQSHCDYQQKRVRYARRTHCCDQHLR